MLSYPHISPVTCALHRSVDLHAELLLRLEEGLQSQAVLLQVLDHLPDLVDGLLHVGEVRTIDRVLDAKVQGVVGAGVVEDHVEPDKLKVKGELRNTRKCQIKKSMAHILV